MKSTARLRSVLLVLGCLFCVSGWAHYRARFQAQPVSDAAHADRLKQAYGQLPLTFTANAGQFAAPVQFAAHGTGYTLFLTPAETVLQYPQSTTPPAQSSVRLRFTGAQARPLTGLEVLASKGHYFTGKHPQNWRTDVTQFARVKQPDVYPGVDVVWYGNQRQLEFDLLLKPGAQPAQIRLSVAGAAVRTSENGAVELRQADTKLRLLPPVAWQTVDDERRIVECTYRIHANGEIGFDLGAYDRMRELVIDPVLAYSTLLGGTGFEQAVAVAVDGEGNAYVAGATDSADFQGASVSQPWRGGRRDAFVAKLNPGGTALLWATLLGGTDADGATEIALDASGNVYVAGVTASSNFPTRNAVQTDRKGALDAFVVKLSAAGSTLMYSTLLGGGGDDQAGGLTVDEAGNAFIAGDTDSFDFPTINAFQAERRGAAVYASNDAGANWQAAGGGLRVKQVNDLAIDPLNAAILYAATERGIFKTINGGMTWTQIGTAQLNVAVARIAIRPASTQILLAATDFLPNREPELWRSLDGGANWMRINILQPPRYLAFDQQAPNTVYVASLNSLFKSTDGGLTFTRLTVRVTGEPDPVVLALAVDPTVSETVYVGGSNGVFKSTNGGTSWTYARLIVPSGGFLSLAQLSVSRSNPSVVYGLDLSGALYRSANAGLSWLRSALPSGFVNIAVSVIAIDPADPNVVYAGGTGLIKSADGGRTWTELTNGLGGHYYTSLALPFNAPQTVYVGTDSSRDAFLCQLNASGSALVFSTYLGGARDDFATGVAVDATGIYVAGGAGSRDFPRLAAYQNDFGGGVSDGFITKFNPAGNALLWSTYLGGSDGDEIRAGALNGSGSLYVTGWTSSRNFPTVRPAQAANNTQAPLVGDSFVTCLSASGQQLVYSTYLGGSDGDTATSIGLDAAGNAYVTGATRSADFPVVGGLTTNPPNNGSQQAFVTKLNASGAAWDYSTLLGGNDGDDFSMGIAVDAAGNAYVTGWTQASNFPTTPGALRRTGPRDAFVTKLSVSADLALTITDLPDPVQVNGTLTYTLNVTNNGPDVAANVVVTDTLPSGATFVSATASTGSCAGTGPVTCNLGNLAGQARATITLLVRPAATGTLTNRATVTSATADSEANNNTATQETRVVTLPSIFGRVLTANGAGLSAVSLALTGGQRPAATTASDGSYQFAELAVGANYTVTPTRAGVAFNPPSRTFNNLTADQRADFSAVPCVFTLAASTQTFPVTGGAGSVLLNAADPQCPWTARSNASWLRLHNVNPSGVVSGNGSATLSFTVEPHVGSRFGTLTIGGNTFSVIQQFYPCATVNLPSANVTPAFVPGGVLRARTADFNRDEIPDLAVITGGSNLQTGQNFVNLQIFAGRREGGYNAPQSALSFTGNQTALTDFGAGDLNGDGYPDLAVVGGIGANYRLWLLLNNGAPGGFSTPREIALTPQPSSLALGDYTGDKRPEIIVGTFDSAQPLLYLANDGAGNFAAPRALPAGVSSSTTAGLEPADVDGDGKLDLFVFRGGPEVAIYKGDGAGALALQPDLIRDPRNGRAVGDFNGDGRPDFAASNFNELRIWLNDGAGRFPSSTSVPLRVAYSSNPGNLLAADFSGDGRSDLLLITNNSGNSANEGLLLFLATGAGNFGMPVNYLPYANARGGGLLPLLSDFTGDGRPDLLLFDYNSTNRTSGLIPIAAQPGGTLALPRGFTFSGNQGNTQSNSSPLATADFNGDGALDLAATRLSGGSVGVLYGNGRGEFSEPVDVQTGAGNEFTKVLARDFNGDGRPDLVALSSPRGLAQVLLNDGRGGFTQGALLTVRLASGWFDAADFNNDGRPDLVVRLSSGGLALLLNNGQGSFPNSPINLPGAPRELLNGGGLALGDFNGDGNNDIAFTEEETVGAFRLNLALGNGLGELAAPRLLASLDDPRALIIADVNNDGRADVLQLSGSSNQLVTLTSRSDGTLAAPRNLPLGQDVYFLSVADLNGDGRLDVLAPGAANFVGALLVLVGRGDGTWEAPVRVTAFDAPLHVTPGDFDNDGTLDLAVARQSSVIGGVLLNRTVCAAPNTVVTTSAASFARFHVAPDAIASLFGANLATATQVATGLPLPTQLAGVTVRVRDSRGVERSAPLFFAAPTQINWQVPPGTAPGVAVVSVANGNDVVATGTITVASVSPGVFTARATGEGLAAAVVVRVRADGSQVFEPVARLENNRFVPVPIDLSDAREQVVLLLFGTGWRGRGALENVNATLGNLTITAAYAGAVPGLIGLDQVNLPLPRALTGSGELNVWLTVDGRAANPVRISIK